MLIPPLRLRKTPNSLDETRSSSVSLLWPIILDSDSAWRRWSSVSVLLTFLPVDNVDDLTLRVVILREERVAALSRVLAETWGLTFLVGRWKVAIVVVWSVSGDGSDLLGQRLLALDSTTESTLLLVGENLVLKIQCLLFFNGLS